MIHHGEADQKANFFSVMTTVAGDAKGENNGASGKVKDFGAVELDDAISVFVGRFLDGFPENIFASRFRVGAGRTHSCCNFLGDSFGLVTPSEMERNVGKIRLPTSRVRQLEQLTTGTLGALAQTTSVIRLRVS
jgi:hypothetical protein